MICIRGLWSYAVVMCVTLFGPSGLTGAELDPVAIARHHRIIRDVPTPSFFEGMLLGNGDVGVCVTVRPDALGLHIGKSDSWDIRVSEDHYQHVLAFPDLLKMWERASDEARRQGRPDLQRLEDRIDFFREYTQQVRSSYAKPWPRPWPCGVLWMHWDSRSVRLVREVLDPSSGLLTLELEHDDLKGSVSKVNVLCFVNWTTNHISISTDSLSPFLSVSYQPYFDAEARLPRPQLSSSCADGSAEFRAIQSFPATAPKSDRDHPAPSPHDSGFVLTGRLAGSWVEDAPKPGRAKQEVRERVLLRGARSTGFRLDLTLFTPRDHAEHIDFARSELARLSAIPVERHKSDTVAGWSDFWSRSAVEIQDRELERIWYHNQYFLACCLRAGKVAPGLFGNWTSGKIGTAWHGDYHMNYNTQQIYWGVFSSNHVDQHLPYVELCEKLLPMSEAYAKEKFNLPGAFFPHSAYPVPSQVNPYPVPPWGYEFCETPWVVQSLWWQYLYTMDEGYLRRVYPILASAARFMAAYAKPGNDGRYHIIPTVSPENWGFTVDQRLNKDCIIDLALTEFLFDAVIEASRLLGRDETERARWSEIRSKMAAYPQGEGPYGKVWLDVADAPAEWVYSIPVTLAPVFPGEQVGLGLREDALPIARRSARLVRLEGGNDLVYQPLILARLGMLDLEHFKREVRYALLPMGVCNDRLRQIDGRYSDTTDFDYMMRMGVWIENLSLPAVLNECMMQSYTRTIRLFPNTKNLGPVRFQNLRAAGAFLVSATWDGATISGVRVLSEKGADVRLLNPWPDRRVHVIREPGAQRVELQAEASEFVFRTQPGTAYRIEPE